MQLAAAMPVFDCSVSVSLTCFVVVEDSRVHL